MTFAARRAADHVGRLSLLALVVTLVVVGIGGIDAFADRMLTTGASRILTDAEPSARTARVVAVEAPDAAAQDTAVRDAIDTSFSGTDVTVSRQAEVETGLRLQADQPLSIRLLDDARVPTLAALTDGEWPHSPNQIALPDAAAERLSLDIGDTVTLERDGTVLTLVGIWAADDPIDPAWHGDPSVISGENKGAIGPAVVAEGALQNLPSTPTITWEIAPVVTQLADIPALQNALTTLRGLRDAVDPQRQRNIRILGELGDTLQRQSAAVTATQGLLVAPQVIIGLLGALVLGIVLATLTMARGEELALLRARGASGRRLAGGAAVEAVIFTAAGGLLALAILALVVEITTAALLTAAGAIAFAAAAAVTLTVRRAVRADIVRSEDLRSDAGVRTLPTLLVPAGIAVGLAALSTWQLFATGTVVREDGTSEPLAAAAPALLLVAACALVPVVAGPLAALFDRLLRRARGIAPILPLRQISRRMGSVAIAILALALASSSVALAIAAPAAADSAEQHTRTALLGGDVRMVAGDGLDTTGAVAATWDGVSEADEMLRTPLKVASDAVVLVAGPADVLPLPDAAPEDSGRAVRAVVTQSFADRFGAEEGTVFSTSVRSVAAPVAFEVAGIVGTLPGVGDGFGVATSPEALHAAGVDLAANELWLRTSTPEATAAQLRADATHPVSILTAAQVSAAPVTSTAPVLLSAGALVAAALGVIGFFAALSAAARARRNEPLVLRALGMRPSRQRTLRAGETVGVAIYAVLAGAALGVAVALAVLPIILAVGS
ncbi:hypothetical protein [Microbacterium sp. H1-D42]|uniref:hypothetical protein n=1 Tax=Microbacterium sp. H1-D42 TaxID=2925844 RepID=UPI001F534C7A|nr:hypothetical protein [Microbacterium sp. H1-D42]UNK72222.1 hypothetical protein MNR00_07210 [Microbacterium sp. H1-D42]